MGSDEEHVSQCGEAIDNDVPVVLCRNILCLTRPKFGRPIDVGGTHAVRTRMPMIIVMSSNEHDLVRRQSRDRFPDLASCARSSNGTGITPLDLLQPGCRRLCCRRSAGGLALRTHAPLFAGSVRRCLAVPCQPARKRLTISRQEIRGAGNPRIQAGRTVMLTRRGFTGFASCALCGITEFIATEASAQAARTEAGERRGSAAAGGQYGQVGRIEG